MATIYLSYARQDQQEAKQLAEALKEAGHVVVGDIGGIGGGVEWRSVLSNFLREADVVVVLITSQSSSSQYVMSEIGAARAYSQASGKTGIIPVVIGNEPIPPVIQDIQAIIAPQFDTTYIVNEINRSIDLLLGIQTAKEEQQQKIQERIQTHATDYIEEALSSLGKRENGYKRTAKIWYALGYIALLAGVAIAIIFTRSGLNELDISPDRWPRLIYLALRSLIVVGLLLASSKYAFSLGKSHMNEALRNSDRTHAISFGKFYLRAYGESANWGELKEVFQHWNIDKSSSFIQMDSKEYDPKFIETLIELAKIVTKQGDKK